MKTYIKISIVALTILFSSCQKENVIQHESEYKGTTYFRVESVNKSGETSYSTIEKIQIK